MANLPKIRRGQGRGPGPANASDAERARPDIQRLEASGLTWLNIEAPTEIETAWLAEHYEFHPLDLEDVISRRRQRAKIDEYADYLFIVLHFPRFDKRTGRLQATELNIFVAEDLVITLPNEPLKPLSALWSRCERSESSREQYMSKGSGYLLYEIVNTMYDYCFPILDKIGFKLDSIEDALFEGESDDLVRDISNIKQEIINYRKIVKPQRPTLRLLERSNQRYAPQDLEIYFDDIVDKSERIWDLLENYKEVGGGPRGDQRVGDHAQAQRHHPAAHDPVGRDAADDADHRRLRDEHRHAAVRPRGRLLVRLPAGADARRGRRAPGLVPAQAVAVGAPGPPDRGPDIMWSPWRMSYVSAEKETGPDGPVCVFCDLPSRARRCPQLHPVPWRARVRDHEPLPVQQRAPDGGPVRATWPTSAALDERRDRRVLSACAQRSQAVVADGDAAPGLQPRDQPGRAAGAGDRRRTSTCTCVPRWAGDTNFMPASADVRVMPQHLDETYQAPPTRGVRGE